MGEKMKIRKISLKDHPLFGTTDIGFADREGKTLDTVVLAGINGSGKTTLLELLLTLLSDTNSHAEEVFEMDIGTIGHLPGNRGPAGMTGRNILGKAEFMRLRDWFCEESSQGNKELLPKIIYMPARINFDKLETDIRPYIYEYAFSHEIRDGLTKDIPKYLASYIDRELYRNEDITVREAVAKACGEINAVFSEMNPDAEIVGLKKDGSRMPIFRNRAGREFGIAELSSGEKQLFIRIMALKMVHANNSVILADEPEISLHPGWQQRILRLYEGIGKNNQIIVATHSPHVISSAEKRSLRLLVHEQARIRVRDCNDADGCYGLPVDRVLAELMALDAMRNPEVEARFETLRNMVRSGNYETDEFRSGYEELENIVGTPDQDLMLIRMEADRLRRKDRHAEDRENRGT